MRLKILGLAVAAVFLFAFIACPNGAPAATGTTQYVGINLNSVDYFSGEQPFLNIFKSSSASNSINGWITSSDSNLNTNEEAFLAQDSDGYVTSLTANPAPAGGQAFTFVQTFVIGSQIVPPGANQSYLGGSYTLQFQGAGTINLAGGDISAMSSSTAGISISGTRITSTMSAGNTATITFTVTPSQGITFQITALPSSTNYIKAISIVPSAYQSNYAAGELFSPQFKTRLVGYSRARFMDWLRTNFVDYKVAFSGTLAAGATSGTLSQINTTSASFAKWPFRSGTFDFLFGTGQVISVHATFGSASITWSTPLSSALPTQTYGQAFFSPVSSWSSRPLLSNSNWSTNGVPIEALAQLCNETGMDGYGSMCQALRRPWVITQSPWLNCSSMVLAPC